MDVCNEKHKRIDEKFKVIDKRLDIHGDRIDKTEFISGRLEERLDGLIKQLGSLTTTLRWFIGLLVGAFVSFFFYIVQQGLIK